MFLEISSVTKTFYDDQCVADNVSLSLDKNELGALLGPSGCGKTTLLRMIAGFEKPDSGIIELNNERLTSQLMFIQPEERNIGFVFQDYALFPHLTVYENIIFGIKRRAKKVKSWIGDLIELTNLSDLIKKYPQELSGGQQQRVALARAIAPEPSLLLLDEPFSSLDVSLREEISVDVRNVLKSLGITALMVTHNQQEAFSLADKTGLMMNGKILQWGKPDSLYNSPHNKDVAGFIGDGVFIKGQVISDNAIETELGTITGVTLKGHRINSNVDVFIRPENICFDNASPLTARVSDGCFRGPGMLYTLTLPSGTRIKSLTHSMNGICPGNEYGVKISAGNIIAF